MIMPAGPVRPQHQASRWRRRLAEMRLRFRLSRHLGAPATAEPAAQAEDWLRGRADCSSPGWAGRSRRPARCAGPRRSGPAGRSWPQQPAWIRPKSLGNGDGPPPNGSPHCSATCWYHLNFRRWPAAPNFHPRRCHQLPAKPASPPRPAGPPGALTSMMTGKSPSTLALANRR